MGTFTVGQVVRSLVDAQGLVRGREYVVRRVASRSTFVGTFLTYTLEDAATGDRPYFVGNGHLVLEAVSS